jgi:predicted transcriptional regulator
MRTTVEIPDELRAKLLEIAGRRGEKGFSRLVEQAIKAFVAAEEGREEARRRALARRGSLSARDASELSVRAADLRKAWR